uniref:Uncharacterized protein n=1 Tax=Sphaerodactylus townsendi TaxID=933632 RepID=A0ACB8F3N3_9SAUR
MSDDEMPLSSAVKRLYQPKSVSFYVPDLGTAKKVDAATNSSSKMKASKKSDSEGNVRVHPKERSPKENTEQIPPGQHGTLTEPHQKLLHASKKNTIKRRKNPEFSAAAQKTSDSSKEVISSRASVNKLPENGNITATCISSPSKNNSAIRITEGTLPASHLQAPNYISDSPSLSPNGTSIMTVSVNALSSDNTISQNTASDIPTILVSSEALMEDVPDTAFLSCHQESLKTATKLQMPDGMTGANNMENYDTKRVNENPERNNELSRTFASDALIASVVLREESIQTEEQWAHNENKVFQKSMVKVSILSNISSLSSNPEMDRNVSDVHMNNESDKLEVPNNQFDEGSREHEDGKVPPEPSVLSEYKVISYGEEAEKSLIPCSTNKAEICVLAPTQSATSADYDKELPLQMGQSKISFSNNNYPSLLCYKDKKPFSI